MKIKLFIFAFLFSISMSAQVTGTVNKVVDKSSEGVETVYNDGKKVVETAYSDTKDAIKYVTPKVEEALKELGKTLKTTSSEVWRILVKQQVVYSWAYLCVLILAIMSWIHFYYRFERLSKDLNKYEGLKDSNLGILALCGILSLSLSIVVAHTFQAMLTGFINPEYGALKTILEVAKNI